MFNKTVFKQTFLQNWKLWLIFTAVLSLIGALIMRTFNPHAMRVAMMMFGDAPPTGMGGGPFGTGTSRFGMLTIPDLMASGFYAMFALIIPLVYVVITANSLIAAQIDRGSMVYTLSTPITRVKVAVTQAMYLIIAILAMFLTLTLTGLATAQVTQNALWGQTHTPDIVATAGVLNRSPEEVSDNIRFIQDSPEARTAGAEARGVSEDVYFLYLELLMINRALDEIADELGVTPDEALENPGMMIGNPQVPVIISRVFGIPLEYILDRIEDITEREEPIPSTTAILVMAHGQDYDIEGIEMDDLMDGAYAAAEYLDMEIVQLMTQLHILANDPSAIAVASEVSGIDEETFLFFINVQLAEAELAFDQGIYFNLANYVNLNIGIFLLMFAIGGVSFMFSCIFNLSRNSFALGAGIPFGFFILNIMANASPDFANLRFLTLNTLYNPTNVVGGYEFMPQFLAMAAIGLVLYVVGISVFKTKDLPL